VYVVSEIRTRRYRGRARPAITGPEAVYGLVFPALKGEKREHFVALYLDTGTRSCARRPFPWAA